MPSYFPPPTDAANAREAARLVFWHPIAELFSPVAVAALRDIGTRRRARATEAEMHWLAECMDAIAEYEAALGREVAP